MQGLACFARESQSEKIGKVRGQSSPGKVQREIACWECGQD
jgi:hypothetical protein